MEKELKIIKLLQALLTTADKRSSNNTHANSGKLNKKTHLHYLIQAFEHPFPNIKFNYVSNNEI